MKISVALCSYNGDKYIEQQLLSIFDQDGYSVDEIQIGDDGSTDRTTEIIRTLRDKYGKIELTLNSERLGPLRNFEQTISRCNGDYICLSDQDDVWHPEKLKTVIPILENDSTLQGCFSNASLIDGDGNPIEGCLWQAFGAWREGNCMLSTDRLYEFLLRFGNAVTGATLVLKSNCRNELLPFRQMYPNEYHDSIIARQLSMRRTIRPIDKELISYRIHDKQQAGIPRAGTWDTIYDIRHNILQKRFDRVSYKKTLFFTWNYYKNTVNELRFHKKASAYLLKRCFVEARSEWRSFKQDRVIPYRHENTGPITARSQSLCFFVGFSDSETVDREDLKYVSELQKYFQRVIVLTDREPQETNAGYEYMVLENKGYDFGFLYQAIRRTNLAYCHTVGFVNNSNRLIRGGSLQEFFSWFRSQRSTFCGMTDSYQAPDGVDPCRSYHLQSHFLIFRNRAIDFLQSFFDEICFKRFFFIRNTTLLRKAIIIECEVGLSRYMIRHGFKPVPWIRSDILCTGTGKLPQSVNPHIDFWEEMIRRGYPLLKKKLVSGKWDALIANSANIPDYL